MNKEDFIKLIEKGYILLDGATGSLLMKNGMPKDTCPEKWILENPEILKMIQKDYVNNGSNLILAPTFGANKVRLAEVGFDNQVDDVVCGLVKLSKEIAKEDTLIAGDVSMTGAQIEPVGDMDFEELIDIYKEQIIALKNSGVDLLVVETMINLQEARAALIAAKEVCDLPVIVTMTFTADMNTFYGNTPESVVVTLQSLGADGVGVNCSVGPKKMSAVIEKMAEYSKVPLVAKPNAGMPQIGENNETYYDMKPEEFANEMISAIKAGAVLVGGCCGTEPSYIKALKDMISGMKFEGINISENETFSNSKFVFNERVNDFSQVYLIDDELDGIDDLSNQETKEKIKEIIDENDGFLSTSVTDATVLEMILRYYPGRALYIARDELAPTIIDVINKYGALYSLVDKEYTTC